MGTAAAAVCYPGKVSSAFKSAYNNLTSDDKPAKSKPKKVQLGEDVDQFRSGETLMLEEAITLSEMVYEELKKRLHVDDIHLSDVMAICNEVVHEVFLAISEDFEIQTGGYVSAGEPHASSDVVLHAKDVTHRVVQEVLDSINEDMEIQTGGVVTGVQTIALDSTVLAKDISTAVTKALERDIASSSTDQYLFSSPAGLSRVVCEEYAKCVDAAIRSQVPTGKCHVIINSTSLAAKTAAEVKVVIDSLKNSRSVLLGPKRPESTSDSAQVCSYYRTAKETGPVVRKVDSAIHRIVISSTVVKMLEKL